MILIAADQMEFKIEYLMKVLMTIIIIHAVMIVIQRVIIIIFLFLRDWRVTLIPCIVIPVSLIGAFFVLYIAGFSINVLTLSLIHISMCIRDSLWIIPRN